ncbi:MAG: flagellar filament capping protein FliD [Kiloniellales bacterium]
MISGLGGSITLLGNKPVITGSFSGLDTGALVQALVDAKRIPAVRLENRIVENDARTVAVNEFTALLDTLRSAVDGLRRPPGLSGSASNVFESKAAFLSSSSTTPASDILGATAGYSAAPGIYDITVQQLAQAHKVAGGAVADATAALGVTETLTVGVAGGTTADLAITATMSLNDIVTAINAQTSTTGVRASTIKFGANDTRIVFTATETNKALTLSGDSGGALLSAIGVSADNGASFTNELQAALPAILEIDGFADPITRDSNEITDIIPEVTLDLRKAEPGTTVTLEIEADLAAAQQKIVEFVDAYNAVREFIDSQREVSSDGTVSETAVLFGDNNMRSLSQRMSQDLASFVGNLGSNVFSSLREIGINLDADSKLTIDSTKLEAALVGNVDQVRGVLEFGFSANSANLSIIDRDGPFSLGDFQITIDGTDASGNIIGVSVAGYGAVFTIDGNRLIGNAGTAFEGLTLAYSAPPSSPSEVIDVSTSLGIAERLYQSIDAYTRPGDGLFTTALEEIASENMRLQEQIARIDARLVLYQQAQLERFAAMEQAIAQANAMIDQMRAMLGIDDDD